MRSRLCSGRDRRAARLTGYADRTDLARGPRLAGLGAAAALQLIIGLALFTALRVTVRDAAERHSTPVPMIEVFPPALAPLMPEVVPDLAEPVSRQSSLSSGQAPPRTTIGAVPSLSLQSDSFPANVTSSVPGDPGLGVYAGPGSGAGTGDGAGSGGGPPSRVIRRARRISGYISSDDYPPSLLRAGIGGTTAVDLSIGVDGRVTACSIAKTSGNAELDRTVCNLSAARFAFEPARDERGRPTEDQRREYFTWVPQR